MTQTEATMRLSMYGQKHVLRFFNELNDNEKKNLLAQIETVDFSVIERFNEHSLQGNRIDMSPGDFIAPIKAMNLTDIQHNEAKYKDLGYTAIANHKVAAVLLAGGQGSRLGVNQSKGLVDIGITRPLFIFECLFNNLMDVVRESGEWIPLYIMTSELNQDGIISFLENRHYFGYNREYVKFFCQETYPAVDFNGKILLHSKSSMCMAPNGNGGWFQSMMRAGIVDELTRNGIEWLNAFAVDNVLQRIADPCFIGGVISGGFDCGAKVIRKAYPEENVGVMCLRNGHPSAIEYYEMTDDMRYKRDEDGELSYNFGVILNYLFHMDMLKAQLNSNSSIHIVKKKIPCLDENGMFIVPVQENGYKFETLILDIIERMKHCLVFEVMREREFAPIKNRVGRDSIESARTLLKLNGIQI